MDLTILGCVRSRARLRISHIGDAMAFRLALNEPVTITGGFPTLTLKRWGVARYSAAGSSPTSWYFNYTVASTDTNVSSLAITGVSLNGARS